MAVTGGSFSGGSTGGLDYATIAYSAVTSAQRWLRRYDGGSADLATSVAVGGGGTTFVTGGSSTSRALNRASALPVPPSASFRAAQVGRVGVLRRQRRQHLGMLSRTADVLGRPRTINTSSASLRCTRTCGSLARLRALTVPRSLYSYSVSPVTAPQMGADCGAPAGVVVHSQ